METLMFFLDGNRVSDPDNSADISIVYEYDKEKRLFARYIETDLTFSEDGYKYLLNKYNNDGFCGEVQILANMFCNGDWVNIHTGIIFLSEIEFDLTRCIATANVSDNSYFALIANNIDLNWSLKGEKTKNGESVSAPQVTVETKPCYRVEDCFRFLVNCMTDLRVGFVSDYFSVSHTHTEFDDIVIFMGRELRTCEKLVAPEFSYKDFFDEINKKFNIVASVEIVGGQPVLRIEEYAYYFQNNAVNTVESNNVTQSTDTDLLYSNVRVGSDATAFNANDDYNLDFPPARFVGWNEEEYNIIYNCNVRNTLDLVSTFKIDSNSIEDLITYASDSYDDDIFLVQVTRTGSTLNFTQSDFLGIGLTLNYQLPYNESLNNDNTVRRWLGAIPADLAFYLGDGNDGFIADRGSDTPLGPGGAGILSGNDWTLTNVSFPNEVSDPQNNYVDPIFTVGADGGYRFQVNIDLSLTITPAGGNPRLNVFIQLEVANGPTSATPYTFSTSSDVTSSGTSTVTLNKLWYLNACDEVRVKQIKFTALQADVTGTFESSSTFRTTQTITGGGTYATFDPADMKVILYEFDSVLGLQNFVDYTGVSEYRNKLIFEHGRGWIRRIAFNLVRADAQITLVTDGR